jgi:DNA-directed RNA polymerase alpha subunit
MLYKVTEMGLEPVVANLLRSLGLTTSDELEDRTEAQIRAIYGVGPKRLASIKAAMAQHRLSLKGEKK